MTEMRRTDFLITLTAAALAGVSPRAARAAVPNGTRRVLWLRRAGYNDEVVAPFCVDGKTVYVPGYREICWLMRDRNVPVSQGYVQFDIVEVEALWEVQQALALIGISQPLVITSGYQLSADERSHRRRSAQQHALYAKAADMYVPGHHDARSLQRLLVAIISGGMGYYDSHVHLDSSTRRWWVGDLRLPEFPQSGDVLG